MGTYTKDDDTISSIMIVSIFCILFFVSGCIKSDGYVYLSKDAAKPANPYQIPYDARSYHNSLKIFKEKKKMCTMRSKGDIIEQWGFIDKGNYVVIRSKDSEKQIVLELFKTKKCKLLDEIRLPVLADKKMLPIWANSILE